MKLAEFLEEFPEVSIAQASDNADILDFFDTLPMKGAGIRVRYERRPDFFAFLKEHSETYFVFLLRIKGKVEGLGTLVVKDGYINGSLERVGYLGDLRVRPGMKNSVYWRRFYGKLINHMPQIDELKDLRHLETAIMAQNIEAKKSLDDSRQNFHYHHITDYKMVNVVSKKMGTKPKYRVREARPSDKHLLKAFYQDSERKKQFGSVDLFDYALTHWKGFNLSSFVVVFDDQGIVGMAGRWYPGMTKKIIVENLPLSMRLSRPLVRPLGIKLPKEGGELKTLYLTHLNVKDAEVISDILTFCFDQGLGDCHVVSFADFDSQDFEKKLTGSKTMSKPMSLYQVTNAADEFKLAFNAIPGLEMALI